MVVSRLVARSLTPGTSEVAWRRRAQRPWIWTSHLTPTCSLSRRWYQVLVTLGLAWLLHVSVSAAVNPHSATCSPSLVTCTAEVHRSTSSMALGIANVTCLVTTWWEVHVSHWQLTEDLQWTVHGVSCWRGVGLPTQAARTMSSYHHHHHHHHHHFIRS